MQVGSTTSLPFISYDPAGKASFKPVPVSDLQPVPKSDNRAGGGTKNYFRDQISQITAKMQMYTNNYLGDTQGVGYKNLVESFQHQLDMANYALSKAPEKPGFDFYT